MIESRWQVSAVFGLVGYAVLRFVLPAFEWENEGAGGAIRVFSNLAWIVPAFCGPIALVSAVNGLRRKRAWKRGVPSARDIAAMSWEEFEELVAVLYTKQGYHTELTARGPDGGVDVVARGRGEVLAIQCKHSPHRNIGVAKVRELLGVTMDTTAARGVLVTSGGFTDDALRFASDHAALELISGKKLEKLLDQFSVRGGERQGGSEIEAIREPAPACPKCGTLMVKREARRGANAGSRFWGCPTYPGCRGIRQLAN
ncbi:MAG: restriction endonuclease [Verrucomicrobiales bacterium]